MKIQIQQDNQNVGPFSLEEIREKVYSGGLTRSTLARVEGELDWQPLGNLLNRDQPPPLTSSATAAPTGNLSWLRDPTEKTTLVWLWIAAVPVWLVLAIWIVAGLGTPLLFIGLILLFELIGRLWFNAHLKANAVRVSPTQLPEVYQAAKSSCDKLGMECPEIYVMQQNVWNAFATRLFKRRMVVLLSGAVDSILLKGDLKQLTWLVGHELGHHWAGHLNLSQRLAKAGGWLIWVNLWHSRRAELTADRVGLYCAGSLQASQLALVNATVGAQLASRVNIAEASAQWQMHRREFFVRYRTLYATHPHLLARVNHLSEIAVALGVS